MSTYYFQMDDGGGGGGGGDYRRVSPAHHDVTWCQQLTSVSTGSPGYSSLCLCATPEGVVPVSSKHFQVFQVFN